MNNNTFDYYYGNEAEQFNFYRIPKILLTDKRFSKVSIEAKVLYGLLLDRMHLSVKNGWIDDDNHVYIYFKLEDAMEYLNIGKDKGIKLFAELDTNKGCGLIHRKRQGLGKPVIIYVKNFTSADNNNDSDKFPTENNIDSSDCIDILDSTDFTSTSDSEIIADEHFQPSLDKCAQKSDIYSTQNTDIINNEKIEVKSSPNADVLTSELPTSRLLKNRSLDFGKSDPNNTNINNTKYSNTDMNNTKCICDSLIDFHPIYPINPIPLSLNGNPNCKTTHTDEVGRFAYKQKIRENIDYDALVMRFEKQRLDGMIEIMLDVICSAKSVITVAGDTMPKEHVKHRLLQITDRHIEYVFYALDKNTAPIRNIKSYLLTALYNSVVTIADFYTAEVNYDFGKRRKCNG